MIYLYDVIRAGVLLEKHKEYAPQSTPLPFIESVISTSGFSRFLLYICFVYLVRGSICIPLFRLVLFVKYLA